MRPRSLTATRTLRDRLRTILQGIRALPLVNGPCHQARPGGPATDCSADLRNVPLGESAAKAVFQKPALTLFDR